LTEETIVPAKTYYSVWGGLLLLLALTVSIAYIHLGWLNTFVSVSIAAVKALVIGMYFMHLRYSPRIMWLFAGIGFFWLLILFTLTFGDYLTRSFLPAPTVWLP